MKKLIALILTAGLIVSSGAWALAETAAGGGAAAYLKMGIGARPLALGGAYVAATDGAASAYYNPAGLGLLRQKEIDTMHAVLTLDRSLDYFAYAMPLKGPGKGTLAFGWIKYGVDGIPETRVYDATNVPPGSAVGDPILDAAGNVRVFSYFEDVENAYTLSYGRSIREKIHAGISLSAYTHELFNNKADGVGLDLGMLWDVHPRTRVGLTVRHLGAEMKWDTASGRKDDVPVSTVLGAVWQVRGNVRALLDLEKTGDEDVRPHFGVEASVGRSLALRGGLDRDDLSVGLGFHNEGWQFDYGFADRDLGDVHRISASRRF